MKRIKRLPAQPLVAAFQSAFVSSATIAAANFEAERSEQDIVQHLQMMSGGQYLQPGSLGGEPSSTPSSLMESGWPTVKNSVQS